MSVCVGLTVINAAILTTKLKLTLKIMPDPGMLLWRASFSHSKIWLSL